MDRFAIDQVYGNAQRSGNFRSARSRSGPVRSWRATDSIDIRIEGLGGHAGRVRHKCIDSVLVGAQLITALQSIVSRSVDPLGIGP